MGYLKVSKFCVKLFFFFGGGKLKVLRSFANWLLAGRMS